jgi:hypothetical protein
MSLSSSWPALLSAPFANSPAIYTNEKTDYLQTELIECVFSYHSNPSLQTESEEAIMHTAVWL